MQYKGRWCIGLVVAVTGLVAGYACSQPPKNSTPTPMDIPSRQIGVLGEYLVTLAAGADVKAIVDLYGRFGIKGMHDLGRNLFLVTLTEDPGLAKMEELRRQNEQINAVQPNFVYRGNGRGNIQ